MAEVRASMEKSTVAMAPRRRERGWNMMHSFLRRATAGLHDRPRPQRMRKNPHILFSWCLTGGVAGLAEGDEMAPKTAIFGAREAELLRSGAGRPPLL
jgi:hypothetical protein